jgi:glycosyltransferase involved in cell wall biosynthesis
MIFPSLFEGFGFPIIEALACGAPVACSNTSSMKEIARDLIPTFSPDRAEDIFRTMENVLSRGWSDEQRDAGLAYANEFDWHKTSEAVVKIYQKVL